MTDKTMVIQAFRTVRALTKTRSFFVEELAGMEKLILFLAISCGVTKKQIFKLLSMDMSENEAFNLAENFDKTWNRCFKG